MSHLKRRMLHGPRSYALLSGKEDASTAVVFVHGFTGNSESTWVDFQNLPDTVGDRWWADCDLFFYDYESINTNIAIQAERFRNFLKEVFPRPDAARFACPSNELSKLYDLADEPPLTAEYRRLVLVGHSLGCVIIRQAISDAVLDYANSVTPAQMADGEVPTEFRLLTGAIRLFAPAMLGFDPTQLPGFIYNLASEIPTLGRFLQPVLRANPVHEELQPDARRLQEIRRRTESFARAYPWMQSLRAHLMFGTKENIVYMDRYDCDPVFEKVEDQDHRSVCKPTEQYLRPLEFVSDGLSKPASI